MPSESQIDEEALQGKSYQDRGQAAGGSADADHSDDLDPRGRRSVAEGAKEKMETHISPERKYVAVSVKHSKFHWKFGMPLVLWGDRITRDDEPRRFGGYTLKFNQAERYAADDFMKHCPNAPDGVYRPDPVPLTIDFMKKNGDWDTVLVNAEQMRHYFIAADIPME